MGPVNLDFLPALSRHYVVSWSGQWNGEAVQTPARQLGNNMLAAYANGDFDTGDRLSAEIQPVLDLFFAIQAPYIRAGTHPWQHNRYYSWLGGGNGGALPKAPHAAHPIPALSDADRDAMHAAFTAAKLQPADDDLESFLAGRAALSRNRLK